MNNMTSFDKNRHFMLRALLFTLIVVPFVLFTSRYTLPVLFSYEDETPVAAIAQEQKNAELQDLAAKVEESRGTSELRIVQTGLTSSQAEAPQQAIPASKTDKVRDKFNTVAYNNNDGTTNWAGDWLEIGDYSGPQNGPVRILNNKAYILFVSSLYLI